MNSRLVIGLLLTITAAVAFVLLSACEAGEEEPDVDRFSDPSIRGLVATRDDGEGQIVGTMLIEGKLAPDTSFDRAFVRVDSDTEFYRREGAATVAASWADVAVGQTVEAWFEGPVAESYPVQAYAARVRILD